MTNPRLPRPEPSDAPKVLKFDDIREAHEAMESTQANGKMALLVWRPV